MRLLVLKVFMFTFQRNDVHYLTAPAITQMNIKIHQQAIAVMLRPSAICPLFRAAALLPKRSSSRAYRKEHNIIVTALLSSKH